MNTKDICERIAFALRQANRDSGTDPNTHGCYVHSIEQVFLTHSRALDGPELRKWRKAACFVKEVKTEA